MQPSSRSKVVAPHHYSRFRIEPVRFIMENDLPFWAGNVVKYTLRYDAKDGIQDLYKAKRYLEMRILQMEGAPGWWMDPEKAAIYAETGVSPEDQQEAVK